MNTATRRNVKAVIGRTNYKGSIVMNIANEILTQLRKE